MSLLGLLVLLPFSFMYIPSGSSSSSSQDVEFWYEYITTQPAADEGAINQNYRADANASAQSQSDSVTEIGPIFGNYDPELAAWLGSEF